jgi:cyclin-dependent kinase 12/13
MESSQSGKKHPLFNGEYEIIGSLGEGNTSKVYKARSKNTGQIVALKLLREEFLNRSEGSLKAVEQEIEILKGLTHPYIIKILGYGTDGQVIKGSGREVKDMVYILLEYVPGGILFDVC